MEGETPESTRHALERAEERKFTQAEVQEAIRSARASGRILEQVGKYGTPQYVFEGTNGLTAVVESAGRNAGRLITAWWRRR